MNIFDLLFFVLCFSPEVFDKGKFQIEACNNFFDYCDSISDEEFDGNDAQNVSSNLMYMISEEKQLRYLETKNNYTTAEISSKDTLQSSHKITTMLDELLNDSGYDKQLRPGISGDPIEVTHFRIIFLFLIKNKNLFYIHIVFHFVNIFIG